MKVAFAAFMLKNRSGKRGAMHYSGAILQYLVNFQACYCTKMNYSIGIGVTFFNSALFK